MVLVVVPLLVCFRLSVLVAFVQLFNLRLIFIYKLVCYFVEIFGFFTDFLLSGIPIDLEELVHFLEGLFESFLILVLLIQRFV